MLASVIAVASGISIAFWKHGVFNLTYAALTFAGVVCLHASVDLLNDYWDYKRGTDIIAKRTKFSGGTGVLPDNLLKPKMVYAAAMILLIVGVLTGPISLLFGELRLQLYLDLQLCPYCFIP